MTPLEVSFSKTKRIFSRGFFLWPTSNEVKYFWLIGLFLAVVGARPALAQSTSWSIAEFRSEISVNTDASISVNEFITVNFDVEKHGIFRTIPFRYTTDQGDTVNVPIEVFAVERNDQPEKYSQTVTGDSLEIKIGDPDKTITGNFTYHIAYRAKAAVNFFEDHDELYWNVTGNDWEVPLANVQALVTLPTTTAVSPLQAKCFTGSTGSTAQNCTATADVDRGTFIGKDEPLTIVFGWPKGVVTKTADYDNLRERGTTQPGIRGLLTSIPALVIGNILFPLLVGVWLFRRWHTTGRDPKSPGTIIAQYDPPAGLTPGEMGVLIDEKANHRDIVATIVDLAVRGYLEITEKKTDRLMGLGSKTDYQLNKKKGDESTLRDHERHILKGIFETGDEVMLSALRGTLYQDIKNVQDDLYDQVAKEGYFVSNPKTARTSWIVAGAIILTAGFFTAQFLQLGLIFIGAMALLFSAWMPKRTLKGAEALWHARGFKLFLEKAEKYRLKWQEKEHIFEQYLPYAMAFGVAEQWSKTFEGIQQTPPDWYHGSSMFNSLVLWSALNNFSAVSAKSFTPPASSGSSGFGGGGFSGGGFGGGGGGSW